jgi:hypothetical protein
LLQALPLRMFGIMQNDTCWPFRSSPSWADPGTQRHGRGPARHHRPAVRPGARRPGLAGDLLSGALLAATTGVVAASVISMGLISLPIMLRYGYDRTHRQRRDCTPRARWRRSFRPRWC